MRLILFIFLFFGGFSVNAQINPKLLAAIQANDLAAVKTINPAPAMLNAQDKNGASALMWAAYKGDLAMVQYLVEQGADHQLQGAICLDDTCGGYYGNLTGIAAGEGKLNMLRYFIEDLKIPVDDVEWNPVTREKDGWTGLTWACSKNRYEITTYLLKKRANPDANESKPLKLSLKNGRSDMANLLLDVKADIQLLELNDLAMATYHAMDSIIQRLGALGAFPFIFKAYYDDNQIKSEADSFFFPALFLDVQKRYALSTHYYNKYLNALIKQVPLDTFKIENALKRQADCFLKLGEYEKSDSIFLIVLKWKENRLGKGSKEYSQSLTEYVDSLSSHQLLQKILNDISGINFALKNVPAHLLTTIYCKIGDKMYENEKIDSALINYKFSLFCCKKEFDSTSILFWDLHVKVGKCCEKNKKYIEAKFWYNEYAKSKDLLSLLPLADLCRKTGEYIEAGIYFKKCFQDYIQRKIKLLEFESGDWGVQTRLSVEKASKYFYEIMFSMAHRYPHGLALENAYDVSLHTKNITLNEFSAMNYFIRSSNRVDYSDSLKILKYLEKNLINVEFSQKDHNIKAIESRINSLHRFITRVYFSSKSASKLFNPHWQDIQSALRPNEAAIEFVDFRLHLIDKTDTTLYAALVLRPEWEAPRFITLFEAKTIAALLDDKQERGAAYAEKLYPNDGRATPVGNKSISLHQLIWAKLDSLLQGVQTLYYSPSGYLNRLNLGAIANPNKQTAAERYHLVQMASTRQLLQKRLETKPNRTAALFGGLQYSADSISMARSIEKFRDKKTGNTTRSFLDLTGESPAPFDTLSFTRAEVHGIKPILKKSKYKYTTLTDFNGTEEALYALCAAGKSPGILHFSTHGFFFSPPSDDSLSARTNLPFALAGNSMLRSGIVLSGCNRFWTTGKTFPGLHDGILTAYEAAQLDLTNTELVVLSACETALGDLNVEGGVFGLQRAFIQAGAHYVMMSLWKVDDSTTQEFMTTFYEKWLQDKKSIPDAFQETQIAIRKAHPNPYFWAPFIIVE